MEKTPSDKPETSSEPERKRSKRWLLAVAAVLVVALGAAAGVVAYRMINSPERHLQAAIFNLAEADGVAADFEIGLGEEAGGRTVRGDFSARSEPDNPNRTTATVGIREKDVRIAADFRQVDDTYYARLSGLDDLGKLPLQPDERAVLASPEARPLIQSFNGKWFSFPKKDLDELTAQSEPFIISNSKINGEDKRKIEEAYRENPFLDIDDLGSATVAGSDAWHYRLSVGHAGYVGFLEAVQEKNVGFLKISDQRIEEARSARKTTENLRIETWIARESMTFKKMKFYWQDVPEQTVTIDILPDAAEVNQPIEAPAKAQDFSRLIDRLFG